jgi:stage II sporulation protein B
VDKPKGSNTIKIKLNGESKSFKEEPIRKNDQISDEFTTIKIDPKKIDQDVFIETAAARESIDESFDWIIPESSDNELEEFKIISNQKPVKNSKKKTNSFSTISNKRNGGVLRSIIVTTVFAILIGTSFGVIMLKFFVTDNNKPAITQPVDENKSGTKDTDKTPAGATSASIGAQTAFVVQGGVFSSEAAAKEGVEQVTSTGVPAQALAIDGKNYVFLGVADSLESAKQLGSHYKANGVEEFFAKQIAIGEKKVTEINESEKSFLEASVAVFQQLSLVTSSSISTQSISDETIKTVSRLGDQINKDSSKLSNEKVKNLQLDLTNAVEKVKTFQQSKETKTLIEAQQHLLNFLTDYYKL